MTTTDLAEMPNQYTDRFKGFMARTIAVARRRIEAAGIDAPIADEARERAQNVLSYALQDGESWAATRDLLLTMAPKMEIAAYRDEWMQCLQTGIAQSQQQGDHLAEIELQFRGGYLYRLSSNYASARAMLSISAELAMTLEQKPLQARALNQLAYLAWQQHHYEEAEQFANTAIAMVDEMSLEKAMSLSALGLVATNRSRYADAEQYHQEALLIRTHHAAQKEMAWSLQNLGLALRDQGKTNTAFEHFKQALHLLDKVYDPFHEAIIQMNLGGAYNVKGEHRQALEIFSSAEEILHRIADDLNLAKLLTLRGLCYLALQQAKEAEQAFSTSAKLFQQLNDRSWYLNAFDGLGISYLEQEKYDQALAIFESIFSQLPEIEGTPAHKYLTATITIQIEQARSKQVVRGKSVYLPPKNQD